MVQTILAASALLTVKTPFILMLIIQFLEDRSYTLSRWSDFGVHYISIRSTKGSGEEVGTTQKWSAGVYPECLQNPKSTWKEKPPTQKERVWDLRWSSCKGATLKITQSKVIYSLPANFEMDELYLGSILHSLKFSKLFVVKYQIFPFLAGKLCLDGSSLQKNCANIFQ